MDHSRLTTGELDAQYRVHGLVPNFQSYLDHWADDSAAARRTLSHERNIRYGDSADEVLDLFIPEGRVADAPVQLLTHGGYWRVLGKDHFSFLAAAIVPTDAVAVVVNYALCPAVSFNVLVDQCRRAVAWTSRNIMAFGGDADRLHPTRHSAGAHLGAMMLATDWSRFPGGIAPRFRSLCGLTGLYDLARCEAPPSRPTCILPIRRWPGTARSSCPRGSDATCCSRQARTSPRRSAGRPRRTPHPDTRAAQPARRWSFPGTTTTRSSRHSATRARHCATHGLNVPWPDP